MKWRFTLIDRDGNAHIIEEPIGWDALEIVIKRDPDTHGIFFDYQGNDFKFYDKALRLIKAEYEAYGCEGYMIMLIEQACTEGYEELYRGRLLFSRYEWECGDECYVAIPIETTSDIMQLRNRWDQKADLQALKCFDGITDLQPYEALGFDLTLPSKGIFIKDEASVNMPIVESFDGGIQPVLNTGWNVTQSQLEIGMETKTSEIGGFYFNTSPHLDQTSSNGSGNAFADDTLYFGNPIAFPLPGLWPLNLSPVVNYADGFPNYGQISNPVQLDMLFNGHIDVENCIIRSAVFYFLRLPDRKIANNGELLSHYELLYRKPLYSAPFASGNGVGAGNGDIIDITAIFSKADLVLNPSDRFYCFITISEQKNQTHIDAVNAGGKAFKATIGSSYFRLTNLSHTEPTQTKVFAINETISRVCEIITDNKIKAYSDYFGRTDSEPYSHLEDGAGSLEAITKGLYIRRQESRNGGAVIAISMKDLWDGLDPIHHIGIGMESDTYRQGYMRLRVEPWTYFYQDSIVLDCSDVDRIKKKVLESAHYSTFKFGYEKYEAEEYNGLDEFLTSRTYRTSLSQIKNELTRLSKFIASGYAWEITRRKGENDSKDWRYDNDTFIICLRRNNAGDMEVELGNVTNPTNIIDPDTVYNYRISPVRNAMRWMNKVLSSYRTTSADNKIIFTDGTGNYNASGKMISIQRRLEKAPLSEKQELSIGDFSDAEKGKALLRPERDTYTYPVSIREFKKLMENPYGKIAYSNDCDASVGWIDEIRYRPEEGSASFQIMPAFTITEQELQRRQGLATEDYQFITSENDQILLTE